MVVLTNSRIRAAAALGAVAIVLTVSCSRTEVVTRTTSALSPFEQALQLPDTLSGPPLFAQGPDHRAFVLFVDERNVWLGDLTDESQPEVVSSVSALGLDSPNLAIAVEAEAAWVSAGMKLFRVDLEDMGVQQVNLPRIDTVPIVEAALPSSARGNQYIRGLASDHRGHLAIAVANADKVLILDEATGEYQSIAIEGGADAVGIAYSSDGYLGVVTEGFPPSQDFSYVSIYSPDLVPSLAPMSVEASWIASGSESFLIGHASASRLTVDGEITEVQTDAIPNVSPAFLTNGRSAVATGSGLRVLGANDRPIGSVSFPEVECAPPHIIGPGGTASASSGTLCPTQATGILADDRFVYVAGGGFGRAVMRASVLDG